MLQVYVLNLPIGHKISNPSRDAVELGDVKWKLDKHNRRRWNVWVSLSNICCIYFQQLITRIPFFQLQRAILGALIMVTLGFMVAYLIPTPGEDQYWMNFAFVPDSISSVNRYYPSKKTKISLSQLRNIYCLRLVSAP